MKPGVCARTSAIHSPLAIREPAFHPFAVDTSLETRLLKVESALAHLEHQHEELNQVVVTQSRLIARLQKEVARASDAMESQELERIRANNQKPPHYQ